MRHRRGLSLQEAARSVGVPADQLAGLENADHAPLSDADYVGLVLRVYTDYLSLNGSRWETGPTRIVEARGVYKNYRTEELTVHALEDVNLSIGRGELVAVMGPSGCGKTTLLNTLSGLDDIDLGEIFIAGEPLHALSDAHRTEYRAHHMGFIFQSFNLMPVLSAVENVELPLLASGAGVKVARRRALEMLQRVHLVNKADHRPNQLSGGQQQRVAIARALVNEPAIVWADEPTGNLDSDTSQEVLDLLLQLNRENAQTFVVVTHDPGVGSLMDRVIRMKDGRIVGQQAINSGETNAHT
ncbi:MAG: ATP-binding cassette domain-containing protein [Rubrobacter sp.]|nr:ATP-binding cassette domain-containing protein [Rubrobacter sp.]